MVLRLVATCSSLVLVFQNLPLLNYQISNIFVQGTEQIVSALPVFVKGSHLELQFVKISNKFRNQLGISLLETSDAYNKICSPDMSGELMLL